MTSQCNYHIYKTSFESRKAPKRRLSLFKVLTLSADLTQTLDLLTSESPFFFSFFIFFFYLFYLFSAQTNC